VDASTPIWGFYESVDVDRATRLLTYQPLGTTIELVRAAVTISFLLEPFTSDRLKGCHRAAFLLLVPVDVYDYFFNSPYGYRGQYAVEPANGEAANRAVVSSLESCLRDFARARVRLADAPVVASLRATDAKIWIYEPEVQAQLGKGRPEIRYAPWETASETGVGLLAPRGAKLEVKGGWLDGQGNERRDPAKATRSTDIHCTGYS
jgi:hypothetical protein